MATHPDAVQAAPNIYKVLLENDRVRVLEIRMKPGDKSAMHAHPDYVLYVVSPAKVNFTEDDGLSAEVEFPVGAAWRDAESHAVENTGSSEALAIAIELK